MMMLYHSYVILKQNGSSAFVLTIIPHHSSFVSHFLFIRVSFNCGSRLPFGVRAELGGGSFEVVDKLASRGATLRELRLASWLTNWRERKTRSFEVIPGDTTLKT
jgi:hypothetical protein